MSLRQRARATKAARVAAATRLRTLVDIAPALRPGLSPDGWLPDRVSVGALTKAFPPELVDGVIASSDAAQERRRLLPARLVMYFVLALWLFRGPNCGYGRVMTKLVDEPLRPRTARPDQPRRTKKAGEVPLGAIEEAARRGHGDGFRRP
jgi:hypothetical protein